MKEETALQIIRAQMERLWNATDAIIEIIEAIYF